jgi:exonuclease SbcC
MIKSIKLKNFLSYEDAEASFDGSTVSITGENGAGKSSLLEAIPYAYFGIGREQKGGMSRIGGDGSHEVRIVEEGNVEIVRGRKSGGAGYCKVYSGGSLVSSGKEADGWIEEHLGMNADTYMLTAFFGLHDSRHDVLIRVPPASRLETMQKLAEIGPYKTFLKKVKSNLSESNFKYEKLLSMIEGTEAVMVDEKTIREGIDAANALLSEKSEELKELKRERTERQVEEEKYQAFVKERERLSADRKNIRKDIEAVERDLEDLDEEMVESGNSYESAKKSIELYEEKLKEVDMDELRSDSDNLKAERTESSHMLDLKKMAVSISGVRKCPLCGSTIDDSIFIAWKDDVSKLEKRIDALKAEIESTEANYTKLTVMSRDLDSTKNRIGIYLDTFEKAKKKMKELERERGRLESELENKENRYIDLTEKLGEEYSGLQSRIKELDEYIGTVLGQIGELNGEIKHLRESLKKSKSAQELVKTYRAEIKTVEKDISAYLLLQNAWSRYGIPLQLIQDMCKSIEGRSTAVYQEFDNGTIEVREVEDRGKPGIEFYLIDRKGERTFGQLSAGEKVMFFISIRVAIAQIVAAKKNVQIDYLVLDEAMGNLSEKRRDDLIRVVNKVLRKLFPQVLMVSHTEMRDIFSQTIKVSAENGISILEVA